MICIDTNITNNNICKITNLQQEKKSRGKNGALGKTGINPFISNTTFLYPLKTSENLMVIW